MDTCVWDEDDQYCYNGTLTDYTDNSCSAGDGCQTNVTGVNGCHMHTSSADCNNGPESDLRNCEGSSGGGTTACTDTDQCAQGSCDSGECKRDEITNNCECVSGGGGVDPPRYYIVYRSPLGYPAKHDGDCGEGVYVGRIIHQAMNGRGIDHQTGCGDTPTAVGGSYYNGVPITYEEGEASPDVRLSLPPGWGVSSIDTNFCPNRAGDDCGGGCTIDDDRQGYSCSYHDGGTWMRHYAAIAVHLAIYDSPPVGSHDPVPDPKCAVEGWACDVDSPNTALSVGFMATRMASQMYDQTNFRCDFSHVPYICRSGFDGIANLPALPGQTEIAASCRGTTNHRFYSSPNIATGMYDGRSWSVTARAHSVDGNGNPVSSWVSLANTPQDFQCCLSDEPPPEAPVLTPVCSGLRASWNHPSAPVGTVYDVYQSNGTGGILVAANAISGVTEFPVSCPAIPPATPATYYVKAHYPDGCSNDGPVSQPAAPLCVPPPVGSVNPICGPGGSSVIVNWTDVDTETGYKVTRNPVFPDPIPTTGVLRAADQTSYTDINAMPPAARRYYVTPFNNCGDGSTRANQIDACELTYSWFSASGDVAAAGGNLGARIPVGSYFLQNPVWYPAPAGMPIAFGDFDSLGAAGNLTSSNVSTAGVLVDISNGVDTPPIPNWTDFTSKLENQYLAMKDRVLSRFGSEPPPVGSEHSYTNSEINTAIANAINNSHIVTIPEMGVAGGDLRVAVINLPNNPTGDVVFEGDATGTNGIGSVPGTGAIIYVDDNVVINDGLRPDDLDTGFLAILAQGNISVASTLVTPTPAAPPFQFEITETTYSPELAGVFYAQGTFSTGAANGQLKIKGSIAGMGGVALQRTSYGSYPTEYVEFNPRYTAILMEIGLRRKVFYEQQIP